MASFPEQVKAEIARLEKQVMYLKGYLKMLNRDDLPYRIDHDPETIAFVKEQYASGKSIREIARELGVAKSTTHKLMVRHDIPRRPSLCPHVSTARNEPVTRMPERTSSVAITPDIEQKIIGLYHEGMPVTMISRYMGETEYKVRKLLKDRLGKLRNREEAIAAAQKFRGETTKKPKRDRLPDKANGDLRNCLKCDKAFVSDGPHNRLCNACKARIETGIDPAHYGVHFKTGR